MDLENAEDLQHLRDQALLCVFAHPDDESLACGGLLAWCADLGVDVSVLCLTRGEHGPRGPLAPDAPPSALGIVRTGELRAACRVLGVRHVTVLDYEDGMLPWADASSVESDIQVLVTRAHPDVVVTFDADGLYWHPDHIAVHERTTEAVRRVGEHGPALYYVTLPSDAMVAIERYVAHEGDKTATRAGRNVIPGLTDAAAFGASAKPPTLVVDVSAFAARKLEAIRCHVTQVEGSALTVIAAHDAGRLLGREQFRRADAGRRGPSFLDVLGSRGPESRHG